MRWVIRETSNQSVQELARGLGISPLLSRLLILRGIQQPDAASRFLHPRLDHLHDPFQMLGMEAAVRRVYQAVQRQEKVLIYGDYDVDGSLAVVVLRMALSMIGAQVSHYIPHRVRDGYGMREEVIEQAQRDRYRVIISVDTGIRAFPVVERARELGLDCIITDHHVPLPNVLPQAHAVLNPKQAGCSYPDKDLCGAGVAFKLAHALLQSHAEHSRRMDVLLPSFLKIVCIGTIADNVPLVGENRVIARLGLEELRKPVNYGLKALIEAAGLNGKAITVEDVAFRLGPRLNAAGRMESAQDVIDLFTLSDAESARQVALKLNRLNSDRQAAEHKVLVEIEDRIQSSPDLASDACLVLEGNGWHRGVVGIVASRVMDRFNRPALVLTCEEGVAHGSGRSSDDFPLLDALTSCGELFDRFGGHACAAGFVLPTEKIPELRRRVNAFAEGRIAGVRAEPQLPIDAEMSLAELSPALVEELEGLGPHGYGNPQPVFAATEVMVRGPRVLKEKHLKFHAEQHGRTVDAIGWRKAAWMEKLTAEPVQLAFKLSLNEYQGRSTPQLELLDLLPYDAVDPLSAIGTTARVTV
ncbi:MAG: single-stranded-DNA-specific exonuclease RecJ [Acidobacteria bacterium]|nr:single-stranded-DNA-specific exonuclease RecJ [Acidobacteriota bacterium]